MRFKAEEKWKLFWPLAPALLALFIFVLPAGAEEAADPYDLFGTETEQTIDKRSEQVADTVDSIANYLDTFFVDENIDEIYRGNRLRIRIGATVDEDGGVDLDPELRLNLRLPRTQNKLNVFVSTFTLNDSEEMEDITDTDRDDRFAVGLRAFIFDHSGLHVSADGGLRFRPEPDPFVRLRGEREFVWEKWILRPTQLVFWTLEDGFGEISRFDFDRKISINALIRNRTELTWSEQTIKEETNLELLNSLFYREVLSPRRAYRVGYRFTAEAEPGTVIREHRFSFTYRQAFYKQILFYEFEPALRFPREESYDISPELTVRLETNFESFD